MKKFWFASELFVVLFIAGISQAYAGPSIPLPLEISQSAKAKIEYTLFKEINGKQSNALIKGLVEVLSVNSNGYEARWTTVSVAVGNIVFDQSSKQAAQLLIGIPFNFFGDNDGLPIRLRDREELVRSLLKSEAFADTDQSTLKKTADILRGLSDEVAAQMFIKVPGYMSICQGTELELGVSVHGQGQFPNPWGGENILSDVTYKLYSLDTENHRAFIEYRSTYNEDSMKQIYKQFLEELAANQDGIAKKLEEAKISRIDTANCELNTKTGWVENMVFSTSTAAAGNTHSERYEVSVDWIK